jgi:hypothetical protein
MVSVIRGLLDTNQKTLKWKCRHVTAFDRTHNKEKPS